MEELRSGMLGGFEEDMMTVSNVGATFIEGRMKILRDVGELKQTGIIISDTLRTSEGEAYLDRAWLAPSRMFRKLKFNLGLLDV